MYLTHPLIAKLVELLQDGVIGTVKSITGQYCAPIAQFVNPDGGGAIFNLGCYPASLLHLVMQTTNPTVAFNACEVQALGHISAVDGNVCDTTLNVQFANGVLAQLHCAETYGMHAAFTIVGDGGSLRFATNPWLPEASGNVIELVRGESERELIEVSAENDAFFYEVKTVRECIAAKRTMAPRPAPQPSDSYEIMQLLTRWDEAARS